MDFNQHLLNYYKTIFPASSLYKLLGSTPNREISFILPNNSYLRYQSFHTSEAFSSFLQKRVPDKIDIGCIYTTRPDTAVLNTELTPLEKELVFDIDLTDYDRECCVGKTICNNCIILMRVGARIMDIFLKLVFGFTKIMYCFSGGRGIHIWVCDKEAMSLNHIARKSIVDFINIRNGMKIQEVRDVMNQHGEEKEIWEKYFVRLDKNVSTDIKHLLKAPFSVHSDSKMVSVPMSLEMLENFSVQKIIYIIDLLENKDLINEYIEYFDCFINSISS